MKKILIYAMLLFAPVVIAQEVYVSPATLEKRERHKSMTIKEWNTDDQTKTRWLDRVTTYDEYGRKVEEIEYATYGMRWRITYTYTDEVGGKVLQEVEYNDKNKPYRIRKYEYNPDGSKAKQYNYLPNGKLASVKVFEYLTAEQVAAQEAAKKKKK